MNELDALSTAEIAAQFQVTDSGEWPSLWYILRKRPDAEPYIVQLLQGKNAELKQDMIGMVINYNSQTVIDRIIHALLDENEGVRKKAADCLGTMKIVRAVEPLITLTRDSGKLVQNSAINALGNIRDRRATTALCECIKSPDETIRIDAVCALHKIRDPASVDAILDALDDVLSYIRYRAVKTLGLLGDKKAVKPLVEMLYDSEDYVCNMSAGALIQLCGVEDIPYLTEVLIEEDDEDVRDYLEYCIEQIQAGPPPEIPREQWLYRAWLSEPTINASSDVCQFFEDGTGEFKYFNMGVTSDEVPFHFRVEEEKIYFLLENQEQWIETKFEIEETTYDHYDEGDVPCFKLLLTQDPLTLSYQQSATYYHLIGDTPIKFS
ncbi:HEAT-like repeat protein [Cylindrospermum stagnale PCC 7417]|uniref:HEAT-like repeat protein n=1 Tax=Cylindrospermum stagnale PCC 7417 TaxID=56107 RepID=K9X1G6_9NOST|nr:HEAT repeat domain-containing protein [Cylindrospermum stagnale]AFZ26465.1 HEAT-like repeat protein [Cylindrospermum stagnale PCC 7417]